LKAEAPRTFSVHQGANNPYLILKNRSLEQHIQIYKPPISNNYMANSQEFTISQLRKTS
jgi:hypothetical protein